LTNAQIFRGAAQYIREHGHMKHALGGDGGSACAVGALIQGACGSVAAWFSTGGRDQSYVKALALASERFGGEGRLVKWNNELERTGEEVIVLFEDLAFDEELKAAATCTLDTPSPETGDPVSQPQLEAAVTSSLT
jgi:hypothetical protein